MNDLAEQNKLKAQQAKLELERQQVRSRYQFNQLLLGRRFTGRRRRF